MRIFFFFFFFGNVQEFISSCRALNRLRGQKYLAESFSGQIGISVGVLRLALLDVKKKMPGEESWNSIFRMEIDDATESLRKFEYENDFVWREKVATGDELPLPEGNKIVSAIPYEPKRWERELAFKI